MVLGALGQVFLRLTPYTKGMSRAAIFLGWVCFLLGLGHSESFATDPYGEPTTAAHNQQETVTAEGQETERPKDTRRVWRFSSTYSRGNDDVSENLAAGGAYETARVRMELVVRENSPGKYESWLIVEPTLSSSQVLGAQLALQYGVQELSKSLTKYLTAEEQEALYQEQLAAERAAVREHNLKLKASRDELRRREIAQSEALQKAEDELAKFTEEDAKKRANLKATVVHLTTLIASVNKAKAKPGSNARLEKMPLAHLEQLLVEAKRLSTDAEDVAGAWHKAKENAVALEQRALDEIKSDPLGQTRERSVTEPPRISGRSVPLPLTGGFSLFKYENDAFAQELRRLPPRDSSAAVVGQKMQATVYLGETKIEAAGKRELQGRVGMMTREAQIVRHPLNWSLTFNDGEITDGRVDPGANNTMMWRLLETSWRTPAGEKLDNPYRQKFLPPFPPKPDLVGGRR